MQKIMLSTGVSRPPRFLNDLHFSTDNESYYHAAVVKYSSYMIPSWGS